jgi:hypothetical protein
VHGVADAVAAEVGADAVAGGPADRADRGGDVAYPASGDGGGDARLQRLGRGGDQAGVCRVLVADLDGDRSVGGPAVQGGAAVDAEQVAVFEAVAARDIVQGRVVDRRADDGGKRVSANAGW